MDMERDIQLVNTLYYISYDIPYAFTHIKVFFHPKFQFRDGNARLSSGDSGAANFARRGMYVNNDRRKCWNMYTCLSAYLYMNTCM